MRPYWLVPVMVGLLLVTGGAHAQQKYPAKPIRLIVPFPAGGGVDIVARTVGDKLGARSVEALIAEIAPATVS